MGAHINRIGLPTLPTSKIPSPSAPPAITATLVLGLVGFAARVARPTHSITPKDLSAVNAVAGAAMMTEAWVATSCQERG